MFNLEPLIQQIQLFTQTQIRTNQILEQILSEIKNPKK